MQTTTSLDTLPQGSRIWVFTANRELEPADRARLDALMGQVVDLWSRKAPMARGAWEVREGRFLVVGCDESAERLSGCSIDAMVAWAKRLEEESGLRLVDRMSVFFRAGDGTVRSVSRAEFRGLVESGELGPRTKVFDPTIASVEELRAGRFELPLEESWHARIVGLG